MMDLPILSLLVWLPILGGCGVLIVGDRYGARQAAVFIASLVAVLGGVLYAGYDAVAGTMQFQELLPWVNAFGVRINYHLAVDGVSVALILLNLLITLLVIIASWESIQSRVAQYLAALLVMEGLVNGVFMAQDALLFYVFFEGMLIPLFLMIGIWGGADRIRATIKYFLYTFLGSVFLLISLIYLYGLGGSFALPDLYALTIPPEAATLVFLSFLVAFGVKIPMWPLHSWLPDAYSQAPTGGSVMLSAISVKVGAYAFYRFALPIVPEAAQEWSLLVVILSLLAILYMGFLALVQADLKRVIAYSSVAHMGFVTLGLFLVFKLKISGVSESAGVTLSVQGSLVQMVSHGLVAAALFLSVGVLADRMRTTQVADYAGVVNRMPMFAALFVLFAMANVGLPGTSGFVGEFMVILASAQAHFWVALLAATTLVIGAAYTLWVVKRVMFGEVNSSAVDKLPDLNGRELGVLGVLAGLILLLGVLPRLLTDLTGGAVRQWLKLVIGD